jgi:hypothetical protein
MHRFFRHSARIRSVALVAMALGALAALWPGICPAAEDRQIKKEESWQVILISGQRIGYGRSLIEPFETEGEQLVRSVIEMHLTIQRFGQTFRIATSTQTEETRDGDLRRFTFEIRNPPAAPTRTVGVVNGDTLELEDEIAGRKSTSTKSWDADLKSPLYQERILRDNPLKPGDSLSFRAFMPEVGKVAEVKLAAEKQEDVKLLDGKQVKALRVRITQSILPGLATIAWLDQSGETLKSSTSLLGTNMDTYTVSREEALKEIDTQELDLAVTTLIKVQPIPGARERDEITYRVRNRDQDPSEFLADGGPQSVKKIDNHTAELTVKAIPIPEHSRPSKSPGKEFLASSDYIQAEDENVKRHAAKAAGDLTDPAQIARAMEKYVHDKLETKNFSTALASAAEVAEKLEGDCTEHAVLLAAMLRAKKIPSRVAVGIVYVEMKGEPSFGGHMWTEAWLDGKWVPLDGTLGRGGTKAGHIKLGDSSFSGDSATPIGTFAPLMLVLGGMEIEVVE